MNHGDALLAIDPGSAKCGLAVVTPDGAVVHRAIVPTAQLRPALDNLRPLWHSIVLGDSTTSRGIGASLAQWFPATTVKLVRETGSTLEARGLYWELHPRRGWRRLLPLSLQVPPEAVDDLAAVVLARRHLAAEVT